MHHIVQMKAFIDEFLSGDSSLKIKTRLVSVILI